MNYLKREQFGSALLLLGMSLGWCISALIGIEDNRLTQAVMLFSIIPFLPGLFTAYNANISPVFFLLFLYQAIITFSAVYLGKNEDLVYNLYLFAVIIALASTKTDENKLWNKNSAFFLTGICIVLIFFTNNIIGKDSFYDRAGIGYTNNYPVLAANMLITLFYSLTFYKYKSKIAYFIINAVLSVMVMLNVFSAVSRTAIMGFLLAIVIFMLKRSSRKYNKAFIVFAFFACIIMVIAVPSFQEAFETVKDLFTRGINSFFGISADTKTEISAFTRKEFREEAFAKIANEMHFKEFLFGFGYKNKYLDFPILQIFMDLGLCGALFYDVIFIFYPLIKIIKKNNYSFLDYIFIINSLNFISVGEPYDFIKLVPVILWYSFSECFKEKRIE